MSTIAGSWNYSLCSTRTFRNSHLYLEWLEEIYQSFIPQYELVSADFFFHLGKIIFSEEMGLGNKILSEENRTIYGNAGLSENAVL